MNDYNKNPAVVLKELLEESNLRCDVHSETWKPLKEYFNKEVDNDK